MTVQERLAAAFEVAVLDRPRGLKTALESCELRIEELESLLASPGPFPYGKTHLHGAKGAEVLLMNWRPGRECAPHDHGASWGWVLILEGEASHKKYQLDARGVPKVRHKERARSGRWIFAPKGLVHSMGNPTVDRLVTLHAYVPTIAFMRVYDPARCASCIVGDNCGAWWPTHYPPGVQDSLPPIGE